MAFLVRASPPPLASARRRGVSPPARGPRLAAPRPGPPRAGTVLSELAPRAPDAPDPDPLSKSAARPAWSRLAGSRGLRAMRRARGPLLVSASSAGGWSRDNIGGGEGGVVFRVCYPGLAFVVRPRAMIRQKVGANSNRGPGLQLISY
jgi:hypothetical protein